MTDIILSSIASALFTILIFKRINAHVVKDVDDVEFENILRDYEDIRECTENIKKHSRSAKVIDLCNEIDSHVDHHLDYFLKDLNLYEVYTKDSKKN